jgi:HD superfamily phosphodiesterase
MLVELEDIYNKNKDLIDKAIEILNKFDYDPLHYIGHTYDVLDYASELLKKYPEADKEICIIAAYWHDVGRIVVDKGHPLESGKMIKEEMEKLNYNDKMINDCYEAIINHGSKAVPKTLEGKIVRDADILSYIGKRRWNQCIKEDYTMLNEIIERLPRVKTELLQLEYSKELFDRDMNLYINDYLKIIQEKKGTI